MKVSLSSTLDDLEDERAAVREVLSGDAIVKESYQASEKDLRARCLDDIAECVRIEGQPSARGEAANCVRLIVAMPKEARVTRVLKNFECPAGGWCGFSGEPTTEELDKDLSAIWVAANPSRFSLFPFPFSLFPFPFSTFTP